MTYYIILLVVYSILGLKESFRPISAKYKNIYTFFLVFPMFILTALRSVNIGNDTISYMSAYNSLSYMPNFVIVYLDGRMEIGYLFLSWLCNQIGLSYLQFQCIISAFIYFSFYKFFKWYSLNVALCCFLFITMFRMGGTMNVIRMYCAIAILIYAIPCVLKRRLGAFLLVVVLASLFHKSSFIFIVLYPLCIRKYNRVEHGFIIFSSIIIAYLGASFFEWLTTSLDLYEGYVNEERFDNMNHTAVFLGLLITLLIYMYAKLMGYFGQPQYGALVNINDVCIKKQSITLEYFCRISLIITIGLSIIGLTNNIMGRVSGYFSIVTLIIISAVLFNMRNSYMKIFVYGVIIFLYTAYFIVILLYRPDWNHLVPYEWGI